MGIWKINCQKKEYNDLAGGVGHYYFWWIIDLKGVVSRLTFYIKFVSGDGSLFTKIMFLSEFSR